MRMISIAGGLAVALMTASCGSGGGEPAQGPSKPASSSQGAASSEDTVHSSSTSAISSSAPVASSSSEAASISSLALSSSSAPSSSSITLSASSASSDAGRAGVGTLLDSDGTFSQGQSLFAGNASGGYNASIFSWDDELAVDIRSNATSASNIWEAQLTHALSVTGGQQYSFCFKAKSTVNRNIPVNVDDGGPSYASLMGGAEQASLTSLYQDFKYTFTATGSDSSARITMTFGTTSQADWGTVYVDDIGVYEGAECGDPSQTPAAASGSGAKAITEFIAQNGAVPPITTSGNKVLFNGEPGSIAGVSLFWSNTGEGEKFYTADVVAQLKNSWGAQLVRAAMAVETHYSVQGYEGNPTYNVQRVTRVVDAAIDNQMYVIIDWHTHHADAPQSRVEAAKTFFAEMASRYGDHDNVIFEIFNEPTCAPEIINSADPEVRNRCYGEKTSWATIKNYALDIIPVIRQHSDNLIIVGTPYYSQFVDEASDNPIAPVDFSSNPSYANNIAYTLHFYAADPGHQQQLRSKAITALKNNVPLFVTEWGTVNANGDGNFDEAKTDTWLQFLYDNDISHANWSLTDKDEGASILTAGNGAGWSDINLTESGRYIKQLIGDWALSIRPGE